MPSTSYVLPGQSVKKPRFYEWRSTSVRRADESVGGSKAFAREAGKGFVSLPGGGKGAGGDDLACPIDLVLSRRVLVENGVDESLVDSVLDESSADSRSTPPDRSILERVKQSAYLSSETAPTSSRRSSTSETAHCEKPSLSSRSLKLQAGSLAVPEQKKGTLAGDLGFSVRYPATQLRQVPLAAVLNAEHGHDVSTVSRSASPCTSMTTRRSRDLGAIRVDVLRGASTRRATPSWRRSLWLVGSPRQARPGV